MEITYRIECRDLVNRLACYSRWEAKKGFTVKKRLTQSRSRKALVKVLPALVMVKMLHGV